MIQNNCRVENFNGIKFYEKDILFDDYVFTNNIRITTDITYITPGFGIVLMDNDGYSIKEKRISYLFKVGYKEASIYFSNKSERTLIKQITCPYSYTIQEHMKLEFTKTGKKITMKINENIIFEEYLKKELDKYNIGYYSNSGNTINTISIASNVPDGWVINMKNTQGGYINFSPDSFSLVDCKNNAEIEQQKISLKAGKYYLKYVKEDINGENDIIAYLNKYDDIRYIDEEKNILDEKNSFTLIEPSLLNLKFVGKVGKIKNIIISEFKEDDYISTTNDTVNFEGSSIDIYLQDLTKVKWSGYITRVPPVFGYDRQYGLILDNKTQITPDMANINIGKSYIYNYEFSTDDYIFSVYDNQNNEIYNKKLTNFSNKITIFKNITAVITKIEIFKNNGTSVNLNLQDENKEYVNANIIGPIIVVDDYDIPLSLSSSYRNNNGYYLFTNWEREVFKPSKLIKLTNSVIDKDDSIIFYGIKHNAKYDLKDIYRIENENINSIDCFCKDYDFIEEKKLLYIDKKQDAIFLTDKQIETYDLIVIDYLKNDSYCINFSYEKDIYEVDISSLKNNNKILYNSNSIVNTNSKKKISQINADKITNLNGNMSGYIVIEKGGL